MIPAQRPGLLRPDAGQQAQDHVSAEPGVLRPPPAAAACSAVRALLGLPPPALRGLDQRGDIVHHLTVSLGVTNGSGQSVMGDRRPSGWNGRPRAAISTRRTSRAVSFRSSISPISAVTGLRTSRYSRTVAADRAVEALGEPVVAGVLNGVAGLGLDAGVLLGLELSELGGDLGPGAAGDLLRRQDWPSSAVADRDRPVPAALSLVLVDRSFVRPRRRVATTRSLMKWE